MSRRLLFAALAAIAASFVVLVAAAGADTVGPITFETSQGYFVGCTDTNGDPNPLHLSVSPDRGDGARMSYLRFEDQPNGVHVFFIDAVNPGPVGHATNFRESDIATLDRAHSHVITFDITFRDGPHNDVVHIYIDGKKKKDGTTWEDYYRYDPEQTPSGNKVPTVDKLLFRESGDPNPADLGNGFLIDRVLLTSSGRAR